jgi:ABC-type sugar transport system substrate-binding protein
MDAKVGLFLNARSDYHGRIVHEAKAAAFDEGIAVEVFDSQNTAAKQAQDLVRFVHENAGRKACALVVPQRDPVDVGVIATDPTFRLAERVLSAGVGWMTINHGREDLIAFLRVKFPTLPIAMVAVDNVEFGRMQARQLRSLLPSGGAALLVRGDPSDSACRGRSIGLRQELEGSGIRLEEVDGQWETHIAEPVVHKWMTSPIRAQNPLGAVVCQNDHMGLGARQALVRAAAEVGRPELAHVPVLGGDGLPDFGRRWVEESKLSATVCATLPGGPAIEQLARHWRDGSSLAAVTRLPVSSYPELSKLRGR